MQVLTTAIAGRAQRGLTVTHGTNQLCELPQLKKKVDEILSEQGRSRSAIEFWDGESVAVSTDRSKSTEAALSHFVQFATNTETRN